MVVVSPQRKLTIKQTKCKHKRYSQHIYTKRLPAFSELYFITESEVV